MMNAFIIRKRRGSGANKITGVFRQESNAISGYKLTDMQAKKRWKKPIKKRRIKLQLMDTFLVNLPVICEGN